MMNKQISTSKKEVIFGPNHLIFGQQLYIFFAFQMLVIYVYYNEYRPLWLICGHRDELVFAHVKKVH